MQMHHTRAHGAVSGEEPSPAGDLPIEGLYGPWDWEAAPEGEAPGPGGPTAVDHHGDPGSSSAA